MLLLDITVVSVALPSIQRDLRASLPDLQWVSAAYALVLAVLLLPAATLGDRLGRRRLFLAGLVIFTAGSLACALAPTALALQLFRALQGVGGAVLFATGTPLLRAEFSGAARHAALSQGDGDAAGADRELQGPAVAGEFSEPVDGRPEHLRRGHAGARRVVSLGRLVIPDVLLAHGSPRSQRGPDRVHGFRAWMAPHRGSLVGGHELK
jgi:hypothetical protein